MEYIDVYLNPLPYTENYAWAFLIPLITAAASALTTVISSKVQQKKQKELIDYSNDKNVENWNMQNEYNRSAIQRTSEDARSAGFSPTSFLSQGSHFQAGSISPVSTPSAPTPDLSGVASAIGSIAELGLKEKSVDSQSELNSANANYLNSLTEGNELQNTFLGDTLPLKTKLTNVEYQNAISLQGYFASNPDLLKSIAEKQKIINENLNSSTSVNQKQLDVLDSVVAKNKSDISLNEKKIASMYIQDNFTLAQIQELTDRNLRENYTNIGYLIDRMKAVSNSNLSDDVKSEKLALLRDLYDNASGNSKMRLQYQYDKNLQDAKTSATSEDIDKYMDFQNKQLDWQKTQFGWNKVFEVVDKTADVLVPWYQQKQGQDFSREMQQNQFEHDFEKQSYEHQHDSNRQFEEHRFKSSENQKDRDQKDIQFSIDQSRKSDEHHNYYESFEGWYDDEGHYHSVKHKSKK